MLSRFGGAKGNLGRFANAIIDEIKAVGQVTFARYMEMALYHPTAGYYTKGEKIIGKEGDYYTAPDVSGLFGKVLADQMYQMWVICGKPQHWDLVEYGAGKGILAENIIKHCREKYPDIFRVMQYVIIEKSPSMVKKQKQVLSSIDKPAKGINWVNEQNDLSPGSITGCIFSNELFDSFPLHRVIKQNGKIHEIYIAFSQGRLYEVYGPLSSMEVENYLNELRIDLEDGQAIEINLEMKEWLFKSALILNKGFILTIDYGDIAANIYSPARPNGTIRVYREHRLGSSLYQNPGDQDITAHVNFTDLMRWGEQAGLKLAGYSSQMQFLINLGILEYLQDLQKAGISDTDLLKETLAVKKLVMPEGMGSVFKVAVQYKGLPEKPCLKGFPPRKSFWRQKS